MIKKEYTWILFDWNGTLLDDTEYGIGVVNELCAEYSIAPISQEYYLSHFGFPLIEFYVKIGFDFSRCSFDEVAERFSKKYHARLDTVTLHTDVHSVLSALHRNYRLGIISAYKQSRLEEAVQKYGIAHYFECMYGVSDDRADSKSHSLKDMITAYSIDVRSALIVGDTLHDVEVARENDMDSLLVEAGHQSQTQWNECSAHKVKRLSDILPLLV